MYLQLDYAKHVTNQGHIVDIENYLQYTLYNASPKELLTNYCILETTRRFLNAHSNII